MPMSAALSRASCKGRNRPLADQALLCHCSVSVTCGPLFEKPAAATQKLAVGQATAGGPVSKLTMPGVRCMCQLRPFHRSASVNCRCPMILSPTAVQIEGAGHATLVRKIVWPPCGLGVGWTRHRTPFQRSASVLASPELPTAVHIDEDVQATPPRKAPNP